MDSIQHAFADDEVPQYFVLGIRDVKTTVVAGMKFPVPTTEWFLVDTQGFDYCRYMTRIHGGGLFLSARQGGAK